MGDGYREVGKRKGANKYDKVQFKSPSSKTLFLELSDLLNQHSIMLSQDLSGLKVTPRFPPDQLQATQMILHRHNEII